MDRPPASEAGDAGSIPAEGTIRLRPPHAGYAEIGGTPFLTHAYSQFLGAERSPYTSRYSESCVFSEILQN